MGELGKGQSHSWQLNNHGSVASAQVPRQLRLDCRERPVTSEVNHPGVLHIPSFFDSCSLPFAPNWGWTTLSWQSCASAELPRPPFFPPHRCRWHPDWWGSGICARQPGSPFPMGGCKENWMIRRGLWGFSRWFDEWNGRVTGWIITEQCMSPFSGFSGV